MRVALADHRMAELRVRHEREMQALVDKLAAIERERDDLRANARP